MSHDTRPHVRVTKMVRIFVLDQLVFHRSSFPKYLQNLNESLNNQNSGSKAVLNHFKEQNIKRKRYSEMFSSKYVYNGSIKYHIYSYLSCLSSAPNYYDITLKNLLNSRRLYFAYRSFAFFNRLLFSPDIVLERRHFTLELEKLLVLNSPEHHTR